jgi:hypothetical protein
MSMQPDWMWRIASALSLVAIVGAPATLYAQRPWSVDPKPVIDIAGTTPGGDVVLEHAVAGTRLSSGTIVVADLSASKVRFFDQTGRLTKSVGQAGAGPGDFRQLMWLGQCAADSIFAWDYGLRRMTVISGVTAAVVRQYMIPADPTQHVGAPTTMSCSQAGRFAMQAPMAPRPGNYVVVTPDSSVLRGKSAIALADRVGNVTTSLGDVWFAEMYMTGRNGGPRGGGFRPLGRTTSVAVASDRVYVGTADSGFVDVYGADGKLASTIPLGLTPRKASRQHLEGAIGDQLPMYPGNMRASLREAMLGLPLPEHLPAYSALLTDPDGILWAVATAPGDSETHLVAVDATGKRVGDVRVPVQLTVFEVGRDYILGRYEDQQDEPHLALFRLRR